MKELTYEEVALALAISPRHVRRIVAENPDVIQPRIYKHRHVRFVAGQITKLKKSLRQQAIKRGQQLANGRKLRRAA